MLVCHTSSSCFFLPSCISNLFSLGFQPVLYSDFVHARLKISKPFAPSFFDPTAPSIMSSSQPCDPQDPRTHLASAKKDLSADLVRHTGAWAQAASHNALDTRPKILRIDDVADTGSNYTRGPSNNTAASSNSDGAIAGDQSGQPETRGVTSTMVHHYSAPWNHLQGAQKSVSAPSSFSKGRGSSMQAEQGST